MVFGSVGSGCVYKALSSKFSNSEKIFLARNVHIGPGADFDGAGGIEIGVGSIFAPGVVIFSRSHNFDENVQALPFDNVVLVAPVNVGSYVWVGARAIILPGVSIGDGAVIGAAAVISRDVPAGAVVVGNPGKIVRFRNQELFNQLKSQKNSFVYQKFGHAKIQRKKSTGRRDEK